MLSMNIVPCCNCHSQGSDGKCGDWQTVPFLRFTRLSKRKTNKRFTYMLPIRPNAVIIVSLCFLAMTFPNIANGQNRIPLPTPDLVRQVTSSIVSVTTPVATGSGVVIDTSGVLITNLHVIEGQTRISITLANGDIYDDISVVDLDRRRDLVLLKIKAFNLAPAALGDSDNVQVGESVVLVGSPEGLDLTVSEGIVSARRGSGEGYQLLQTSAPASPGSSGGGMFNEYGELIGIVTLQYPEGQNLNFAIPINYARGLISTDTTMTLEELAELVGVENTNSSSGLTEANASGLVLDNNAKLSAIISSSGLNFDESSNGSWRTTIEGVEYMNEIIVTVRIYNDDIVLVTGVPPDPETEWTVAQLRSLLDLNYDIAFAKVGFDSDGSVWTLREVPLRSLDGEGLKLITYAVALAADDVAGIVDQSGIPTVELSSLSRSELVNGNTLSLLQGAFEIHYDPTEWIEEQPDPETDITQQFHHSSGELFVLMIAERASIPADTMLDIAFDHVESQDPNASVVRRGSRMVNGVEVLFQEYGGTLDGIPAMFLGHFYSNSNGTIQILGWTASNLVEEHRRTVDQFVSGFVVADR